MAELGASTRWLLVMVVMVTTLRASLDPT